MHARNVLKELDSKAQKRQQFNVKYSKLSTFQALLIQVKIFTRDGMSSGKVHCDC